MHGQEFFKRFWDDLASKIMYYDIRFLAGDFNMSFTEVVKQLRSRGIACDCAAWYPWRHSAKSLHNQFLGFDSCGIFYIGGNVYVSLNWGFNTIDKLTAVAGNFNEAVLDEYSGENYPGQHWAKYKAKKTKKSASNQETRKKIAINV